MLCPGLGVPVNCAEVNPLNRGTTVGALRKLVVVTAETGTIVLFVPRTYSLPMSLGVWRNCCCASRLHAVRLAGRLKSLM